MQEIEQCNEECAPGAERQEYRTGHGGEQPCNQRLRNGTQVEVTQGLAARQKIVQKFAFADIALPQRNRRSRTPIGCLL